MSLPVLTPTEFVAFVNQTLEFAYEFVDIEGEVTNFKISKNRWVYFDLQDEISKVRCFGTVYMLPGPIEDGMRVRVRAAPRLHHQFGFSLNLQSLEFSGEGTIKKAADLLMQKLEKEGLFASERKRIIPYPPQKIGLITSGESAAYKDFIKVLGARYGGLVIEHIDVAVQGESAVGQIVKAVGAFNRRSELVDVLVIIRGGGSSDDLQAFSSEQVTRAVAASRIPTLVAIGHEVDTSLAELAADLRASTPSNAAELLVPDRKHHLDLLSERTRLLEGNFLSRIDRFHKELNLLQDNLQESAQKAIVASRQSIQSSSRTLDALSPRATLQRGYAIVRSDNKVVKSPKNIKRGTSIEIEFASGNKKAEVQ